MASTVEIGVALKRLIDTLAAAARRVDGQGLQRLRDGAAGFRRRRDRPGDRPLPRSRLSRRQPEVLSARTGARRHRQADPRGEGARGRQAQPGRADPAADRGRAGRSRSAATRRPSSSSGRPGSTRAFSPAARMPRPRSGGSGWPGSAPTIRARYGMTPEVLAGVKDAPARRGNSRTRTSGDWHEGGGQAPRESSEGAGRRRVFDRTAP